MTNWLEIYSDYLLYEKIDYLVEKYNITKEKLISKIEKDNWEAKRNNLNDKLLSKLEKRLENLAYKAFYQLEDILADENASTTSKLQAAKTVIDVTGFKKNQKETEKEVTWEVVINRKSVKCE